MGQLAISIAQAIGAVLYIWRHWHDDRFPNPPIHYAPYRPEVASRMVDRLLSPVLDEGQPIESSVLPIHTGHVLDELARRASDGSIPPGERDELLKRIEAVKELVTGAISPAPASL